MITKFDTSSATSTKSSGGSSKIITFLIIGAALYAGYRFILKPYLEKNKKDESED